MPLKVQVVIDHIIPGDEESLSPTQIRSAISKSFSSVHSTSEVRMNGIKIECDDDSLSHHLQASPENPISHLRSPEVVQRHAGPLFLKLQDARCKVSNLPVSWAYTLQKVKETIELQHGISAQMQTLSIDGQELDNEGVPSDLMVSCGTALQLGVRLTGAIPFKVRTLRGQDLVIQEHTAETVNDLMLKLEELEGVPVAEQRILFSAYQLCDTDTLGHYGIGAGSVVRLVGRLRGCDCGCGKDKYYLHVDLTYDGDTEPAQDINGCHVGSMGMEDDVSLEGHHQTLEG